MSLQLYIGPSGSGKSHRLYQEIIQESIANPRSRYYIIVPDQFTMETQKQMCLMHPDKGILNIEVLSFGRLTHRIFEETGQIRLPVLDDTGKSLILRNLASIHEKDMPYLSGNMKKPGFIQEVKSVISELMQYGADPALLRDIIRYSEKRGSLCSKLKDILVLYEAFLSHIEGRFVTTEGMMGLLSAALPASSNIKGSTVVFDGFTGFTPVQADVIRRILTLAREVRVAVIMEGKDADDDPDNELFSFSKKMQRSLYALADAAGASISDDIILDDRPRILPALTHLERNLFRHNTGFAGDNDSIFLTQAEDPLTEVTLVAARIKKLIQKQGFEYRDIALVAGDLSAYADYIREVFDRFEIPIFLDASRGIVLNPFTEFIRHAFNVLIYDFSYESVFAFLRSGFTDISMEETDRLENYVLKYNIRGKSSYSQTFVRCSGLEGQERTDYLEDMNRIRESFIDIMAPLMEPGIKPDAESESGTGLGPKSSPMSARAITCRLYSFITGNSCHERLLAMKEVFEAQGDVRRASEYGRVYKKVMELLELIHDLLGDEELSLAEYLDIIEAGFGEISLGSIPQDVDRISAGDMERTRLRSVKVLFFLGVNDGNIPKRGEGGGLISDMDREFLEEGSFELSPGPRARMEIQRLYLYMNMTKPEDKLFISWSARNAKGDSIRPSYLIDEIRRLYPGITTEIGRATAAAEDLYDRAQAIRVLGDLLRDQAAGMQVDDGYLDDIYRALLVTKGAEAIPRGLMDAAFYRYRHDPISKEAVKGLYGDTISGSVSRLESYCACAFRYYLQYGLSLKEREVYGFEWMDMGSVYHGILQHFTGYVKESGRSFANIDDKESGEFIEKAVERVCSAYGDGILLSDARNRHIIYRIERIMKRTVSALKDQIKKGDFVIEGYEESFSRKVKVSDAGTMRLTGSIDRLDVAEDDGDIYVRILDYKSGKRSFSMTSLYYGLQLQLSVYLNEAIRDLHKKHPDKNVIPAGLLYYRIQDPIISTEEKLSDEGIESQIQSELRMDGILPGDADVIRHHDGEFDTRSTVIPVTRKKDGSFDAKSKVCSPKAMDTLLSYADAQVCRLGEGIFSGDNEKNPYVMGTECACTYCGYKGVCGFDEDVPGYSYRELDKLSEDEALRRMEEYINEQSS